MVVAFQTSAATDLFDYYISGTLTGLYTAPVYEGKIITSTYKGAGAAMQELSKYSVKVDLTEADNLKTIRVYASTKTGIVRATQKAAEAADRAGDLLSFSIVKS